MDVVWEETARRIRQRINEENYEKCINNITFDLIKNGEGRIIVPDAFFKEWFIDNYLELFKEELGIVTGSPHNIRLVVSDVTPSVRTVTPRKQISKNTDEPEDMGVIQGLTDRYSFQNFVVGPSNQFAVAACKAVASGHGRSYNPLFIYGGVGLGKTHLLHSIGISAHFFDASLSVTYLSSEHFTNEMIRSIRMEQMDSFREKYRNCDILLIDDIQFIAGKERTQEEFFHTFNSLYSRGSQIIVTSDKFPQEISGLEERIQSRFEQGLIADIQPPEMETRVAIISAKAEQEKIIISNDVAFFLATNIRSNVRELEGALIRLVAYARFNQIPISVELARKQLKAIYLERSRQVTVSSIQRMVANYYNVKIMDMNGNKRTRAISRPRQIAMYLSRKHTSISFPEIGKKFGGKNHTTVINACRNIDRLSKSDPTIRGAIEVIEKSIPN